MSYVAFTAQGELPIDATECEREDGFFVFYYSTKADVTVERAVSRGLFRRSKIERETRVQKRREWVMHIREDYVNMLVPAPDDASGILTEGGDAKQAPGDSLSSPTRSEAEGDAHA